MRERERLKTAQRLFFYRRIIINFLTPSSPHPPTSRQYVNSRHADRVARHILRWSGATAPVPAPAGPPLGSEVGWAAVLGAALEARLGPAAGRRRLASLLILEQ